MRTREILLFTSPLGGEVGERSSPGEGVLTHLMSAVPPHPDPLPQGEREKKRGADS